jgi:hypothetical protein
MLAEGRHFSEYYSKKVDSADSRGNERSKHFERSKIETEWLKVVRQIGKV